MFLALIALLMSVLCQLSINNPIEAIYFNFAVKRRIRSVIRFSCQVTYNAGSNLHKLISNYMMPVFVNQKSLICAITDCKT